MGELEGEWQVARAKRNRHRFPQPHIWSRPESKKAHERLQEQEQKQEHTTNRFAPIELPEPFRFLDLPGDLRNEVYDLLEEHLDTTFYHLEDAKVPEQWRGIPNYASREQAADDYTNILLTNRQIYHEFQSLYCTGHFSAWADNTVHGPRSYPPLKPRTKRPSLRMQEVGS